MALQTRSDMELWDRPFQTLLLVVLAINVLAHVLTVPWWIVIGSGIALGWKLGHLYFAWPLPKRPVLYVIGAAVIGVVFYEYQTMLGHEAATPVLVFLASLKLLETNRDRDAKFIILTSYFLLMAHLLHSQSLLSTFFMAFDVAFITILTFQLHRADRRLTTRSIRPVVRLLIYMIPVWMCLFIVFPRFTVKTFRQSKATGATGFSEGVDPGSVSSLAQSDALAFRVRFISGPRRSPENLYWRGTVLYDGDGLRWRPRPEDETRRLLHPFTDLQPPKTGASAETLLTYEIMTEPDSGYTVFALPRVIAFDPHSNAAALQPMLTPDPLIRFTQQKRTHLSYTVTSIPEEIGQPETLTPEIRESSSPLAGRWSLTSHAQTSSKEYKALIERLRENTTSVQSALQNLDEWYANQGFRYTLTPQSRSQTLDEFLFHGHQGFCEHYAAASATILRSLGYRTRVAVGYQGGKWNGISNTLMVRARDAHAWVEVWIPVRNTPGKGRWLTYDPTAAIAPLRLRLGGDFLDLPEDQQQEHDVTQVEALQTLSENLVMKSVDQALMFWDYAQMSWTQFLLNYDQSGQRNLLNLFLQWLGLTSRPWLISTLIAGFFGIALRLLFLWHTRYPSENAARREWLHLEKELKRIGALKSLADGPLTIRTRVDSPAIREGIDAFITLQYGKPDPAVLRRSLRTLRHARREAKRVTPKVEPTP